LELQKWGVYLYQPQQDQNPGSNKIWGLSMDPMEKKAQEIVLVPTTNQTNSYDCLISVPDIPQLTHYERQELLIILGKGKVLQHMEKRLDDLERGLAMKMLQRNAGIWSYYESFSTYIDDEALVKILTSIETLNSSWHENISALITAQLLPLERGPPNAKGVVGSVVAQAQDFARIRRENVFKAYDLLSVDTSEGVTMLGKGDKDKAIYLIKTPKNQFDDRLAHEAVVGLALNTIRDRIPNFVYTYSYTNCSPPVVELGHYGKDEVVDFCSRDSKSSVLILELIQDGQGIAPNLMEWSMDHSAEDLSDVLKQLDYALKYANQKLGFVHGDLHAGNVLVRTFGTPVPIPGGGLSNYIPVIIDYGYSTIQIDGIDIPSTQEPVSQNIGVGHLEASVGGIDMYHLMLSLARKNNFTAGSRHNAIAKLFAELGYGNLREKLRAPRPANHREVTHLNWLTFWDYYIPSQKERENYNKEPIPDPPDIWSQILTTCDFASTLVNYSKEVETLVELWYLLYGTYLKNLSESTVRKLMKDIMETYDRSALLRKDVDNYNKELDYIIPEVEGLQDMVGVSDEVTWKKIMDIYRRLIKAYKDIHVLNTVSSAMSLYKPMDRDAQEALHKLTMRLPASTISKYTEMVYSHYVEAAHANWASPKRPWTKDTIKDHHPFWSLTRYHSTLLELNQNLLLA
jgi:serine/threonine protein kinase